MIDAARAMKRAAEVSKCLAPIVAGMMLGPAEELWLPSALHTLGLDEHY